MANVAGGLGVNGPGLLGLGTSSDGGDGNFFAVAAHNTASAPQADLAMAGRVSNEQVLVEWEPTPSARISGEHLLVEWAPITIARVSNEQLLVEWKPTTEGRVSDEQLLVEWKPSAEGRISSEHLLVEWTPATFAAKPATTAAAAPAGAMLIGGVFNAVASVVSAVANALRFRIPLHFHDDIDVKFTDSGQTTDTFVHNGRMASRFSNDGRNTGDFI